MQIGDILYCKSFVHKNSLLFNLEPRKARGNLIYNTVTARKGKVHLIPCVFKRPMGHIANLRTVPINHFCKAMFYTLTLIKIEKNMISFLRKEIMFLICLNLNPLHPIYNDALRHTNLVEIGPVVL